MEFLHGAPALTILCPTLCTPLCFFPSSMGIQFCYLITLSDVYFGILLFFFNVYLFLRQRETEHERGEGQRERETQNPKQAPGSELSAQSPMWGLNS